MPRLGVANNAGTFLVQACTVGDTTIYVHDISKFPSPPFRITVDNEIMEVTAVDIGLKAFAVSRAQEGTTATSHNIGASVENRWTAGTYGELAGMVDLTWNNVANKPTSFIPSAHKSTHASGGSDALTPADIGAAAASDFVAHLAETVQQGVHGGINPKFLIDSEYIFSRSSIAYRQDGTQVAVNQPRFEGGKFGQAVMVEEGTTNLLTAEDSSFEGGTLGNWTTNVANVVIIDSGWHGTKAVQVTATARNARIGQRIDTTLVSLNDTVTLSAYAKLPNGSPPMDVTLSITIANVGYRYITKQVTSDKWTRLSVTTTLDVLGSGVYAQLFAGTLDSDIYGTVIWDGIQLEKKSYSTSWILGGYTRSPESITIPTAGVLSPTEGTVEFWAWLPEGPQSYLFVVRGNPDDNNNNRLFIYGSSTGSDNQYMKALIGTGSNYVVTPSISITRKAWHYFACRWTATELKLTIDNTTVSAARSGVCTFGGVAYIGSSLGHTQANFLIDNLRISSRARTDQEIADAYNSGMPLLPDKDTTWWAGFNGESLFAHKFRHASGGTDALSPADIGAVQNAGNTPSILANTEANRPAAGTAGRIFIATDTQRIYRDTGTAWSLVGVVNWGDVAGKPSTFPPSAHKSTHASGGSDALTPADIGAVDKAGDTMTGALALPFDVTLSLGTFQIKHNSATNTLDIIYTGA